MTCKWLGTIVSKSPIPGVVGPLPNGRTPWLIKGGCYLYLSNWDDPPSTLFPLLDCLFQGHTLDTT